MVDRVCSVASTAGKLLNLTVQQSSQSQADKTTFQVTGFSQDTGAAAEVKSIPGSAGRTLRTPGTLCVCDNPPPPPRGLRPPEYTISKYLCASAIFAGFGFPAETLSNRGTNRHCCRKRTLQPARLPAFANPGLFTAPPTYCASRAVRAYSVALWSLSLAAERCAAAVLPSRQPFRQWP